MSRKTCVRWIKILSICLVGAISIAVITDFAAIPTGIAAGLAGVLAGLLFYFAEANISDSPGWSFRTTTWVIRVMVPGVSQTDITTFAGQETLATYWPTLYARIIALIPSNIKVGSVLPTLGLIGVLGDKADCLALKELLEREGLATMEQNEPDFRTPRRDRRGDERLL